MRKSLVIQFTSNFGVDALSSDSHKEPPLAFPPGMLRNISAERISYSSEAPQKAEIPPGTRSVLGQIALHLAACLTVFDDLLALTVRTSYGAVCHGPLLALEHSKHRPNVTSIAVAIHF